MSKGARIKELHNPRDTEVIVTMTLKLLRNGGVEVTGPIDNSIACFDIIGKALLSIAAHTAEQQNKKIIPVSGNLIKLN